MFLQAKPHAILQRCRGSVFLHAGLSGFRVISYDTCSDPYGIPLKEPCTVFLGYRGQVRVVLETNMTRI